MATQQVDAGVKIRPPHQLGAVERIGRSVAVVGLERTVERHGFSRPPTGGLRRLARGSLIRYAPDTYSLRRAGRQIPGQRLQYDAGDVRLGAAILAWRGVDYRHDAIVDNRQPDMTEARRRIDLDHRSAQPRTSTPEDEVPGSNRRLVDSNALHRFQIGGSRRGLRRNERRREQQQTDEGESKHWPSLRCREQGFAAASTMPIMRGGLKTQNSKRRRLVEIPPGQSRLVSDLPERSEIFDELIGDRFPVVKAPSPDPSPDPRRSTAPSGSANRR